MGYLFLNEQKEKIQPTHRSGMGLKAIKQNKDGPPFCNEGDECAGGEAAVGWALSQYPPSFLFHKITPRRN
jgi:hypothetical protein